MDRPLTRQEFNDICQKRDGYKCVVCKEPSTETHHLFERRLFGVDGNWGYYRNNGVSLCNACHRKAEQTIFSVEYLLDCAGIKEKILPPHLYQDNEIVYDKWGNVILPNGQRTTGELFYDESVQKILTEGGVIHLYTDKVKYPRTYHIKTSPGMTKDDRMIESYDSFVGEDIVVTLKMDGENTTMYRDYIHARSLEYETHMSRDRVKAIWGNIAHEIPTGWRLCGENLYARHSIHYSNLPSYFMVFSIWNEKNEALSWYDTEEWCEILGLTTVPVLYKGKWDQDFVENFYDGIVQPYSDVYEGFVVRVARSFKYGEFRRVVGKYVRKGHVASSHHWKFQQIVQNGLI